MTAKATFALNAGVWFRRGHFVIFAPDSQRLSSPPSGRKSTYQTVQICEASSDNLQQTLPKPSEEMTMKLYYMPGACSLATHIVLEWTGTPYDTQRLSHAELKTGAYLSVNSLGAVPALALGESVLTQNAASGSWRPSPTAGRDMTLPGNWACRGKAVGSNPGGKVIFYCRWQCAFWPRPRQAEARANETLAEAYLWRRRQGGRAGLLQPRPYRL